MNTTDRSVATLFGDGGWIAIAKQVLQEAHRDSLGPGKPADLAIPSDIPLTANFQTIEVEETILRGATAYLRQASGLQP